MALVNENVEIEKKKKNKKVKKSKLKVISFDEEIVSKEQAQKLLASNINHNSSTTPPKSEKSQKKNKKKRKSLDVEPATVTQHTSNIEEHPIRKIKKRKTIKVEDAETTNIKEEDVTTELDPTNPTVPKKKESIRERKRKQHAKLLEEKKIKTELTLQQKSLNYLSKWKHSKSDWKFEKLKQIWLHQNMYDCTRVPMEFWETLVEYFSNSTGKVKDIILKEALQIIETGQEVDNSEDNVKKQRARDVIQNLQE